MTPRVMLLLGAVCVLLAGPSPSAGGALPVLPFPVGCAPFHVTWPQVCTNAATTCPNPSIKTQVCTAFAKWSFTQSAQCQACDVCGLTCDAPLASLANLVNAVTQKGSSPMVCSGQCPAGYACKLDPNYCTNHPTAYPCITPNGQKPFGNQQQVFRCMYKSVSEPGQRARRQIGTYSSSGYYDDGTTTPPTTTTTKTTTTTNTPTTTETTTTETTPTTSTPTTAKTTATTPTTTTTTTSKPTTKTIPTTTPKMCT